MGWTIRRGGNDIDVSDGQGRRETVLRIDGDEADRQTADYWEKATLTSGDLTFEAQWGPRNTITSVHLLDHDHEADTARRIPLVPPPGSRAARRESFARDRPRLFVLQRVGVAAAEIVIGVLGVSALIGALLGQLLPRIDLSWIPRPSLPDIDPPDWLRYVDPLSWLGRLDASWPSLSVPGWLDAVLSTSKYWFPLVVAVVLARRELDRRRTREDARDESSEDDPTPDA